MPSYDAIRQKIMDEYTNAGVSSSDVWLQSFVDALEQSIHGAKLGTPLQSPPVLFSRDGTVIKEADNKPLHLSKQKELYFHIIERVKVHALLKELKSDAVKKSAMPGTEAWLKIDRAVVNMRSF